MNAPRGPAPEEISSGQRVAITACVMIATLMQALDSTIANVALPYMQGSLAATSDQINWVLTSYIVSAAIMTPTTGWLERRFGRRRVFITCVVGFVVASMLCGTATSLTEMVLFRVVQGVFGAPLVPIAQSTLLDTYPASTRGQAMAVFGLGVMLGPIIGPTLGGWLTEYYDWRWVFYVNVPIGAAALALALGFLPRRGADPSARIDIFGFATLGLAIASLQLFLDRGEQLDWFSSVEIQAELALFLLGLYLFVVHTVTARRPTFVDRRLFADRTFVISQLLVFVVGAVLLATLALLSPYLENLLDYPVLTAGLVLAPRGIGTMIAMVVVGRLIGRVDARLLLGFGFGLTAFALHEMSLYTLDVSEATIIRTGIIQGFGIGFVFVPLSTVAFATLPSELRTQGTGFYSLMRNIGSSVGISMMSFLLIRNGQILHSSLGEHISPFARGVQWLGDTVDLTTEQGRATVNDLVVQQAEVIAYADCFRLMMFASLAVLPLILLVQRADRPVGKPASAGAEMH
ncbi:DHA2 family efflux MFS transporter permease subunit [Aureimonas flava]|uniref:DHA2 family efflux MFS transporter permease subunit n=1 Tax=Aureimonas flava TaxID=2320271 RepID=A0A3A1WXL2_9HYPH|nr:DHA2 family efflux MFS transporter permease subunit [Aureimonas flava]RIY03459.1 DHA2 family efflux MFS transporter permease subunit [Aureimonas flava]